MTAPRCPASVLLLLVLSTSWLKCHAFVISTTPSHQRVKQVVLKMGWFDNFLSTRQDDFVRLEETEEAYGPGPLLILYNIPSTIDDEEIGDMCQDGAPSSRSKVKIARLSSSSSTLLLDDSVETALGKIMDQNDDLTSKDNTLTTVTTTSTSSSPVLLFSGFVNDQEMMATYRIISTEIYQETQQEAACAKVVPNAMAKRLRQVLEEISSDHANALSEAANANEEQS